MSAQNNTLRTASSNSRLVVKNRALIAALMASAAYVGLSASPASAVIYNAANDGQYDSAVGTFVNGDTINLTGPATHNGNLSLITNGILNINAGGSITDDTGGLWGTGMALTISSGTSVTVDGFDASGTFGYDTFASLAGAGTLTVSTPGVPGVGPGVIFGGNNASTAFSGTVVMPNLDNFLAKVGTGTWTVNGMTMAQGDLRIAGGTLANTGGTTNIKSIGMGTGTGNSAIATMSGGVLNITGVFAGGPPCGSGCPSLRVGDFGGVGVFNQSGGTVNIGGAAVAGSFNIGNQGGNGTYNMSGGTMNMGVVGDVTSAGLHSIGRSTSAANNSTGVFAITGGTVNVNAGELINGDREAGGAGATTSSTINLSGGTLSVKAGANLWLSAHDNLAAIDSTFNLSGTGVLEVGDGSLQAGYGGGTGAYAFNLNGGTIRVIGSDLTTTVDATLLGASATAGTQLNTNGLNANWNGILSGAGWLVKTGAGTLNLGGVNTYTGGTAFNGGVVFADATSDLGANASAMSFNGGTLQLGANGVLAPKFASSLVMAGAGTIDTNGFSTIFDGAITGGGALTKTGANFLDLGGNNNAHTGALNINAGTLFANFGNAIGNTSAVTVAGGALLSVNTTETIGSLAGAGAVNIQFGTLTTGGNGASTTFSGTFGATGGALTKTGTGTFNVVNTAYTGLTTVNQGVMIMNGTMADGLLVNSLGTFGGNATITGNVTNNGRMSPGNSPGTIAIGGNYTAGVGAIFDMEVIFNSANAPVNGTTHDFVTIAGNVTGTTLLNVIPFAPSNAATATTGNGIELVRVGGTVAGNQFALAAPVFVGAYQYTLNYLPNFSGLNDGFFLQSRLNENFFGDAAMFSANQALIGACFSGEDALVGDGNGHVGRAWAKVSAGSRNTDASTGIATDQNYTCGSGGMDVRTGENFRFGISGGYGETDVDVTTLAGIGDLDGEGGVIQAFAGFNHGNFFANLNLGYGNSNWTYDGPLAAPVTASMNGVVGSFQVGALWPMGENLRFGAIGEVGYDAMDCSDQCLVPGTVADTGDWTMKGTLRLDGTMHGGMIRPYAAVSFSTRDGNTITNGSGKIATDTAASVFGAKAGATVMVGEQTGLFLNGGLVSGDGVDGWDGTGGIKIFW